MLEGQRAPRHRSAIAYIERDNKDVLCVWNKKFLTYTLPGGKVENEESIRDACVRELHEETGMNLLQSSLVFVGKHEESVIPGGPLCWIYRVVAAGDPVEREKGCPIAWMSREKLIRVSSFRDFYRKAFAHFAPSGGSTFGGM